MDADIDCTEILTIIIRLTDRLREVCVGSEAGEVIAACEFILVECVSMMPIDRQVQATKDLSQMVTYLANQTTLTAAQSPTNKQQLH